MPASTYHVAPMPTHAHVAEKHEEVRVRTDFGHKSKPKTLQEAMKMRGDPGDLFLFNSEYFHDTPTVVGPAPRTVFNAFASYSAGSSDLELYG